MNVENRSHISQRRKGKLEHPARDIAITMAVLSGERPLDLAARYNLSASRIRYIFFRICRTVSPEAYRIGAETSGLMPRSGEKAISYLREHKDEILEELAKFAKQWGLSLHSLEDTVPKP